MMKSSSSNITTAHDNEVDIGVATTNRERRPANLLDVREEDDSPVLGRTQQRKGGSGNATRTFTVAVENGEGQVVAGRRCDRRGNLKIVVHHSVLGYVEPDPNTPTPSGKIQTLPRGKRPFAGNVGRYAAVEGGARRLWVRDQVTLQVDVVALLHSQGHLPKKRIITGPGAALAAIDTALSALLDAQLVECYKVRSRRGRMDEFWCNFGQSPARPTAFKFPAAATLAAMQSHATQLYGVQK